MPTHRISVDIDEEQHRQLKIYCAQWKITVKEFVLSSINDKMTSCWLTESLHEQSEKKKKETKNGK